MNKPLYNITKKCRELTREGQKVWDEFIDSVKWTLGVSFFKDADSGELADIYAEAYPHLRKMDIYNAIVALRA